MTKTVFRIGSGAIGAMTTPEAVFRFISDLPLDDKTWAITVEPYRVDRTAAQNRLSFRWYKEIEAQIPDSTAEEWRAYCKLTIGVPILRAENEKFRSSYDSIIRPLTYEQKIELMTAPIDLPVTSLMKVEQFRDYLDRVQRHFAEQGVQLTSGDDEYQLAMGRQKHPVQG